MIANYAERRDPPRVDGAAGAGHRGGGARAATPTGELVLDADGEPELVDRAGRRGRARAAPAVAVDVPRLPRTTTSATAGCFAGGWYLTGDLARRDADGWFWFVGRGDDVIKSAGHLIGPFEVESALMEHPAVAEAGVIGMPDPVAGEVVKAFVALKAGYEPTDELRLRARRLRPQAARRRRGAARDRVPGRTCPTRAAARSCAGC